jgi:hypothetical protein
MHCRSTTPTPRCFGVCTGPNTISNKDARKKAGKNIRNQVAGKGLFAIVHRITHISDEIIPRL